MQQLKMKSEKMALSKKAFGFGGADVKNLKFCASCGEHYKESENFNWSCYTHLSEYGDYMWWCCGKKEKNSKGCKVKKHVADQVMNFTINNFKNV